MISKITGLSIEEIEKIHKDTSPLEALDYLHRLSLIPAYVKPYSVEEIYRWFLRDKIEKSLKAFNILKYRLDVVNYGMVCDDPEPEYWLTYNNLLLKKLTKEEYEILKEALK